MLQWQTGRDAVPCRLCRQRRCLQRSAQSARLAYRASDLAVSRAGAGGISEFASIGLPSILIPYPYAADNHQEKNAEVFESAGASVWIRNEDTTPEHIGEIVIDLLSNPVQLIRMAEKARSLARINAAVSIVESIVKEIDT